jgi:hypothetical protein
MKNKDKLANLLFQEIKENIEFLKVVTTADNTDDLGTDEFQWFKDMVDKLNAE